MSTPFPPQRIKALYPDGSAWRSMYGSAVQRLVETGVIVPEDAATMLAHADSQDLPT